jgi:hypothetical protein
VPAGAAITRGAFAEADRLFEQATGIARAGGDLADAPVELCLAVTNRVHVGDTPDAVPPAREALAPTPSSASATGGSSGAAASSKPWSPSPAPSW